MKKVYKVFHLFSGIGGFIRGTQKSKATFRGVEGVFRCLGGVDIDPGACRNARKLTGASITEGDLKKMTPAELRAAAGGEFPDVVCLSPPCTGFSGLLGEAKSKTKKYQDLNALVCESLFLTMEAFKEDPPALILLENVPRIQQRGADLLDRAEALLANYGYVFKRTTHDCGEIGGLGQHRPRFLLIARHAKKIPNFVYQPPKLPMKTIGDVIGNLPLPGDPSCGPMHKLPKLQMKTWIRLALIPAGGDWRDLPGLEGKPDYKTYGVVPFDQACGPITSKAAPGSGPYSVADPRWGGYGVRTFDDQAPTVTGARAPGQGDFSVADPRWFKNVWGVKKFDGPAATVTGGHGPSSGAQNVADPRIASDTPRFNNVYRVVRWDEASVAVTGATGNAAGCVADPRLTCAPRNGAYGISGWDEPAATVAGSFSVDNSRASVADPRALLAAMLRDNSQPEPPPLIISEDGTWHRPLTTFELAALQTLELWDAAGNPLVLDGNSTSDWRMWIGNMVPNDAAEAIGNVILHALLVAGEGAWVLSNDDVWVKPEAKVAL